MIIVFLFQRYDDTNRGRCDYVQNLIAYGCDDEYLVTPKHKENIIRVSSIRISYHLFILFLLVSFEQTEKMLK